MIAIVEQQRSEIEAICRNYDVQTLDLFGSAADGTFDPASSDVDFLVVFSPCEPSQHYERYFGVLESLQSLFGRPIDLVESDAMRNPYFIQRVQRSRKAVYAA